MDARKLPGQRIFDLYLLADTWHADFNAKDRGVGLSDDSIAWIVGSKTETMPLAQIVSVRLQYMPENEDKRAHRTCTIDFGAHRQLIVTDRHGRWGQKTAPDYRAFVHDLHNRLVAYGSPSVRYLAGKSPRQARIERVILGAFLLLFGLVSLLSDPAPKSALGLLFIVLAAVAFLSAMGMDMSKVTEYDPTELPEALIVPDEGRLARTR
ncbi:hypothetical protein AB8A28_12025 [Tardiphaga sp. 71_E8_N1_1]|jgi:hypothetical protein|uniref:hypothetical protein n=1 Tax=Tardiphaga TaxID=1395974 RepID=UPI00285FABDB|nr:hypothetical protein [Tardiphaga robiniae]MDR6662233.1 hypothetical protein [Tardiphaga robiniae]